MKLENLICSAFTYLEFDKNFDKYYQDNSNWKDDLRDIDIKSNWDTAKCDYELLSRYMDDRSIKQAQRLIIELF